MRPDECCTFSAVRNTVLDARDAVAELLLRSAQILVRIGEMLDLVVELLFDL